MVLNSNNPTARTKLAHLGVEVSVVDVFVVEIGHPSGNVTGQVHLLSPAQGDVILAKKLLQTAPTHILMEEKKKHTHKLYNNLHVLPF